MEDDPNPAPEPQNPDDFAKAIVGMSDGFLDDAAPVDPVKPDPVKPDPVKPDPVKPDPVKPSAEEDPKPKETETETPPVAEKDEIDAIEEPKGSAAAAENFKKIKETAKGYKSKLAAAEGVIDAQKAEFQTKEAGYLKEIEELKASAGELVELRERKGAYEAAEKEFSVYAVTKTEEYKKTVEAPLMAIEERATAIAKKAGVSANELLDAISELDDDKQAEMLEAAMANLSAVDGARVLRMAEDARGLILRDREIRQNAQAAQKELKERQEQDATKAKEKATKEYKDSVANTVEALSKRLPFVELVDGETKEGVFKGILDKAQAEDFDQATPATKGTAAVSVIMLERATRQLQKQGELIKTLEARLAEQNRSTPSVGNDVPPPPAPKDDHDPQDAVDDFLKLQRSHRPAAMQVL